MYLDSAIIVKLLVREPDSAWFNRAVDGHQLRTSELALAEVRSAIYIKERGGLISANQRKSALARFEELLTNETLNLLPLDSNVVQRSVALLETCHPEIGLRSLDALHLASAQLNPCGPLCTTDGKLRAAATRVGVINFPEDLAVITQG